jgi:hypothetical protein
MERQINIVNEVERAGEENAGCKRIRGKEKEGETTRWHEC